MLQPLLRLIHPATFVVCLLLGLLAIAWIHPTAWRWRFASELSVYLLLILACASWPPLRRIAAQLGSVRLAVLALMFGVAALTQLRKWSGQSYPFGRWTMYSNVRPSNEVVRFDAALASERTIPFPFTELTPSKSPRAFQFGFRHQIGQIQRAERRDSEDAAERRQQLERQLSELASIYNERNPADSIRFIRVHTCTVPIRHYLGPESVECSLVLEFDVSPEREP
jgi:hypothetical protein